MSNGEVQRYIPDSTPIYLSGESTPEPTTCVVLGRDHERIVAELKSQLEHSETKVTWLLRDNERVVKEKDAEIESLRTVLEAVRSQMCWERDRDQLTMGMASLHDDVTKALEKGEA